MIPPPRGEGQSGEEDLGQRLADLVLQMGDRAGRLALSMDLITDALCLAGQHPAYCRKDSSVVPRDIRMILDDLAHAKALVQEVLLALRADSRSA